MTELLADWATANITGKFLDDHKISGAVRYVSPLRNGKPNPKDITKTELEDLFGHKKKFSIVFESTATRALTATATQAVDDGKRALECVHNLDLDPGKPVFFAVDTETKAYDQLGRYGNAFADGYGSLVGVYGSYYVVKYFHGRRGAVRYYWQTRAWSYGKVGKSYIHLYQNGFHGSYDTNELRNAFPMWTDFQNTQKKVIDPTKPVIVPAPVGKSEFPVLQQGSKDVYHVLLMQYMLTHFHVGLENPKDVDGDFGPKTESAINLFQVTSNLPNNGIFDDDDWRRALVLK